MNKNSLYKARAPLLYALFISLVYCNALFAQNNQPTTITGIVTDTNGALPGVTITVTGTLQSTIADNNGKFSLTTNPDATLTFSFIGYKEVITSLDGRTILNITMTEDATALKEVTVNAGYYTVKDKARTGSISKITSKDIEKQPVTNVIATMQGRMAGVNITQTSGVPGGGFEIQIRGQNSLRAEGNSPRLSAANQWPLPTPKAFDPPPAACR